MQRRIGALQRRMASHEVDAALIGQNVDLFYFTGSMQSGMLVVPAAGRPIYAVRRVLQRAIRESPLDQIVPFERFAQLPALVAQAAGRETRRIGLELDVLPVAVYNRITAGFTGVDWVDISGAIRQTRALKSAYEIDKIRAAAKVSSVILETAIQSLREGITELELSGLIEAAARRAGHQGYVPMRGWNQAIFFGQLSSGEDAALQSFPDIPLAGAGPSAASPIGAGRRRIVAGEPVILDYVAALDGYLSDQTRTLAIGSLPEKFSRAHEAAAAILKDVESAIRPGTTPEALYRRALDRAEGLGFSDAFMGHGALRARYLGHGVGLDLDEWPVLAEGWTHPLEPGHVFCVEPKMVFPDEGAVGIEDQYVVTAEGVERLTLPEQRLFTV